MGTGQGQEDPGTERGGVDDGLGSKEVNGNDRKVRAVRTRFSPPSWSWSKGVLLLMFLNSLYSLTTLPRPPFGTLPKTFFLSTPHYS